MKLTVLLLTIGLVHLHASGVSQSITFSGKNISLEKIFAVVEVQTGYVLFSSKKMLADAKLATISAKDMPLAAFLREVLTDQSLVFDIQGKTITLSKKPAAFAADFRSAADSINFLPIKGRVTDSSGNSIPAVNILIKGTNTGTTTDDRGNFSINAMAGQTLVFSSVEFETREIIVAQETNLTIILIRAVSALNEVEINAGYYSVKDRERTGSISKVTAGQIQHQPVNNVLGAIQGRIPGVNIIQNSAMPGGGFDIELRGLNSLNLAANKPLYIVDGVPFSQTPLGDVSLWNGTLPGGINPLNVINPNDIQSIEVLKDADATAIYGARGANGVILITTKSGNSNKTELTLNTLHGFSKVARFLRMMNTEQYLDMRRQALKNDGITTIPGTALDLNGTWETDKYTDWQKEVLGGTAQSHSYQLGVSGGGKHTRFFLSASHNNEGALMPGNFNYTRTTVMFKVSHLSTDEKFQISATSNISHQYNNLPRGDIFWQVRILSPNHPDLYNPDGTMNWNNGTGTNRMSELTHLTQATNKGFIWNLTTDYRFTPSLRLKLNAGLTQNFLDQHALHPHTQYDPKFGYGPERSTANYNTGESLNWIIEPQLSWEKEVRKHKISTLIGTTFQDIFATSISMTGINFNSNDFLGNIMAATTRQINSNTKTDYRYTSLFGRLNYHFDQKYLLNVTARRDGSSRFGPGKRFGTFMAVGTAWIFSKEEFIKPVDWLDFGKIRASYGSAGSDNIGDYQFLDTYTAGTIGYDGATLLTPSRLFNPDFYWEITKKFEVAIELELFKGKLSAGINYFQNRSSNQLVGIPLPRTTGFSSIQGNLGATVQNSGWEFMLESRHIRTKDWRWNSSFNLTLPYNKLLSFPGLEGSTYATTYRIGMPVKMRRALKYTGIDPNTGLYTFQDFNGDGKIALSDDRQIYQSKMTKFYGGLSSDLGYKRWKLSVHFQFSSQQVPHHLSAIGGPGYMSATPLDYLDSWTPENKSAKYQKSTTAFGATYSASDNFLNYSDAGYVNGSFIRLKNLSLTYELRPKWIPGSTTQLYIQGQNLLTLTGYQGEDPEVPISSQRTPPLRVVAFGVNIVL